MFSRLKAGISRTRDSLKQGFERVFKRGTTLDAAALESLETVLLQSDVGYNATTRIVDRVRSLRADDDPVEAVHSEMATILAPCEQPLAIDRSKRPFVILMIGVNGAGKTTSIAKLTQRFQAEGLSVMLAAGDTFRAAAVEQLSTWGERLGVPVVAQGTGADPASVIFDACSSAQARGTDVLIADTAGRLHTQGNLMAELKKVHRVIGKSLPGAPHETLLVLDATMGQNALAQVEQFGQAVEISGLCLTKLDGSAKGGVIFALAEQAKLPIRFIGVGEQAADLQVFSATDFTRALLGEFGQATDGAEA